MWIYHLWWMWMWWSRKLHRKLPIQIGKLNNGSANTNSETDLQRFHCLSAGDKWSEIKSSNCSLAYSFANCRFPFRHLSPRIMHVFLCEIGVCDFQIGMRWIKRQQYADKVKVYRARLKNDAHLLIISNNLS